MLEFYIGCACVIPCVVLALGNGVGFTNTANKGLLAVISASLFSFFVLLLWGQHGTADFWEMSTNDTSAKIHSFSLITLLIIPVLFASWIVEEYQRNSEKSSALLFILIFPVPYVFGRALFFLLNRWVLFM